MANTTTMRWRGAYPVRVPDELAWGNDDERLLAFLKEALHRQVDEMDTTEWWATEED